MSKKGYEWQIGSPAPPIQPHSIVKHKILREYLVQYIQTLTAPIARDRFRLTLVDGFAGGGLYTYTDGHTIQEHHGSPLIMLSAVDEVIGAINNYRTKPIEFDIQYYFVEKKKHNFDYLRQVLIDKGWGHKLGKTLHLRRGIFQKHAPEIINSVLMGKGGHRAIFLLDQYGYTDIPLSTIRNIFETLKGAEIIFTFGVDSLLSFLSDTPEFRKNLSKIGLDSYVDWEAINIIKSDKRTWRGFIQQQLYKGIIAQTGACHYNPFFIHCDESHWDYWLFHLCMKPVARDVMNKIHWSIKSSFRHFGKPGLNMLGYDVRQDPQLSTLAFDFGDEAHQLSVDTLAEELPRLIHEQGGLSFQQLYAETCNQTPANKDLYRKSLGLALEGKDVIITGPKGQKRRKTSSITDKDIILPSSQRSFLLFPAK